MNEIARFRIRNKLGTGNKGTVYRCDDPELKRSVAVKLLDRSAPLQKSAERTFKHDVKTITGIQHLSIVPIYELGKHSKIPFLVYEFVEGKPLSSLIHRDTPDIAKMLDIFRQIVEVLSLAHSRGIVHRDLRPCNVIIATNGIPRVMDFGIARLVSKDKPDASRLMNTLRYLSPEYVKMGKVGASSDVFALGVILHELLTGRLYLDGMPPQKIVHALVNTPTPAPSSINPEVETRLDSLVLKAVHKDPAARFKNAAELLIALQTYRQSGKGNQAEGLRNGKDTVQILLRKLQDQKDFPALSQSITMLNRLVSSEDENTSVLAGEIVKDFALTSKILKVVNSAYYGNYSGTIGTISRAIVVLGVNTIQSIAASLIFFDHLHNKAQSQELEEQTSSALFSAILARQTAENIGYRAVEESFLCALLHNLGRILVTYYLHDESLEIERVRSEEGVSEEKAQHIVLGTQYHELGMAVSRQWNFPDAITLSMQGLKSGEVKKPANDIETQQVIANFANETTQLLATRDPNDHVPIDNLLERFKTGLKIDGKILDSTLAQATESFTELAGEFANRPIRSKLVDKMTGRHVTEKAKAIPEISASKETLEVGAVDEHLADQAVKAVDGSPPESEAVLVDGLQEVTNILLEEHTLPQIFNVVLETMYRGMNFNRVILCLQDRKTNHMVAKLGFGTDTQAVTERFRFPLKYSANVFNAATRKGVDVYIADILEPKIHADLPAWYKSLHSAGCFMLFPLTVNKRTIGLIYADHNLAHGLDMTVKRLNLLKALRNQIILALNRV